MGRITIALCVAALGFVTATAFAQNGVTVRYPRVYGATGRPYGPTQAHYQYQRQYGRPWHGYGGLTATFPSAASAQAVVGYPGAYLSYGYNTYYNGGCQFDYGVPSYGFSVFPSYTPPVPPVIYGYPPVLNYNPLATGNLNLGQNPLPLPVPATNVLPPVSSPEAKLKSVRAQAQGDQWFQQQEYHKAIDRYKVAVSEAQDRGEAHLRLAICYAALNHLDLAVRQIKRGIAADPQFIAKADPLKTIFGETNSIAQGALVRRATLWAKEDLYDADRLFLLGALLYLEGDQRAVIPLETGLALAGGGEHFESFLAAAQSGQIDGAQTPEKTVNPKVIDQAPLPPNPNPPNPNPGQLPPLPAEDSTDAKDRSQNPLLTIPD